MTANGSKVAEGSARVVAPSLSQEATLGVFRTADLLRRRFASVVEPYGITIQQYHVLRILRRAGTTGAPTLAIAERLVEHAPGITRLLDRLEKKGWVSRQRATEDRRQVLCRITLDGLAFLAVLDGRVDDADDQCLAMLSPRDLHTLVRLLGKIRAAYHQQPTDSASPPARVNGSPPGALPHQTETPQ